MNIAYAVPTAPRIQRSVSKLAVGVLLLGSTISALAQPLVPGMYGSDRNGTLFRIDCSTGATTTIGGSLSNTGGSTEIEYDNIGGTTFSQDRSQTFSSGNFFDITTGVSTSATIDTDGPHIGLEYVGTTLYATVGVDGNSSDLHTLDPSARVSTPIGATGFRVSGLAYDTSSAIMYGIEGGGSGANLLTIDLGTGAATIVGNTGLGAVGSLQFCADGSLLAGTGESPPGSVVAGGLYKINKATGEATLLADSGFGSVTGLTLVAAPTAPALNQWLT